MILDPPDSEVAGHFDACKLIVFNSVRLSRFKDLQALPIHDVTARKKMKSRDALASINDMNRHPLSVWTKDRVRAGEIQKMMRETTDEIRALMARWFPARKLGPEMHSWRYTVTKDEPLHWDVYATHIMTPVIRIFVNLDTEDRLWDVGSVSRDELKADEPDRSYGHGAHLTDATVERVSFAPGDVWLVNSRRVAHAIIYGRRAVMFSFETV